MSIISGHIAILIQLIKPKISYHLHCDHYTVIKYDEGHERQRQLSWTLIPMDRSIIISDTISIITRILIQL